MMFYSEKKINYWIFQFQNCTIHSIVYLLQVFHECHIVLVYYLLVFIVGIVFVDIIY